jgi:aryl-alcohol dehydrogenase-like predicted oxidoreductase
MIYKKFINDFKVSNICYGTWGLSPSTKKFKSPGKYSKKKTQDLIKFALKKGINFFDTADIYGEGVGERILGSQLSGVRKKVFIMTKGGIVNSENKKNFSIKYIKKKITNSLSNLKTHYIDGYQLHNLNSGDNISKIFKELTKLKKNGILRSIGFSSRDPEDAIKIIKKYNFDFLQVGFSVYDQRLISSGLLKEVKKRNLYLLTRSPFNSGYLTENNNTKYFNKKFQKMISKFKRNNINKIIYSNKSLDYSALKYCISFKEIISVIVGMASKLEIEKNVRVVYQNTTREKNWKKNLITIYE